VNGVVALLYFFSCVRSVGFFYLKLDDLVINNERLIPLDFSHIFQC